MYPIFTQTPFLVTKEILSYCAKITKNPKLVFIEPEPDDQAALGKCFSNVQKRIQTHGGMIQYGWLVQVFPRVVVEFEFHAVWKKNTDELVDITPQTPPYPGGTAEKVVLFLPVQDKEYTGIQIANLQFSLNNSQNT